MEVGGQGGVWVSRNTLIFGLNILYPVSVLIPLILVTDDGIPFIFPTQNILYPYKDFKPKYPVSPDRTSVLEKTSPYLLT